MDAYAYSDFLVVRVQGKDDGARGLEHIHDNMKAAAEKASASEGTRDARPRKMLLASFKTKSHRRPLHSSKVPETSLMHVLATYEKGESDGPATEHEATNKKDLKTNDLKDSTGASLTYPDPMVTRNIFLNFLAKVNTHLDALVKSARNRGGGS